MQSGVNRFSIEMSVANLMSCHHINSAYLCERHGVMRRELNSTCLGSLYMQDFVGATNLCKMQIVEQVEPCYSCKTIGISYIPLLPLLVTSFASIIPTRRYL
jgi:hypothetical protein